MPLIRPVRRTTDAEFEAFAGLCQRLSGFGEYLPFDYVDGFLTALVCAPVRPPQQQWLQALCADAFERACADPSAEAEALAVFQARLDAIATALDPEALADAPDALRLDPLLAATEAADGSDAGHGQSDRAEADAAAADGSAAEPAAELAAEAELARRPGVFWAEGFLAACERLADALGWPPPGSADDELLQPLLEPIRLLQEPSDTPAYAAAVARLHPRGAPTPEALVDDALFAVQDLRLNWIDVAPRVAPRRVTPAPGRNDPCPCGSGRKYKKCHGAAA